MEKDVICNKFDKEIKELDSSRTTLKNELNNCIKALNKYKNDKTESILITLLVWLLEYFLVSLDIVFFVNRDIAFLLFYLASGVASIISICGIGKIINCIDKIKLYTGRKREIKKRLIINQKIRDKTMNNYNAYKTELKRKSNNKIKNSDEDHIDELIRIVNNNNNLNKNIKFKDVKTKKRSYLK